MEPKPPPSYSQALSDLAKELKKLGQKLGPSPAITKYAEKRGFKPEGALNWFYQRREREAERIAFEERRKRLEAEEAQRRQRRNPQIFAGANAHLIGEVQRQLRNHAGGFKSKKAATDRAIEILKRRGQIAVGNRQIHIGEKQRRTVQDEIVSPIWPQLPKPVRRRRR